MLVTLDVFSGRPNPSWQLADADVRRLVERIANRSVPSAETREDAGLGYRGLIVSAVHDDQLPSNLPTSFRIGGGQTSEQAPPEGAAPSLAADEADETARWLLSTGHHVVSEEVLAYVEDTIQLSSQGAAVEEPAPPLAEDTELKQLLEEIERPSAAAAAVAACLILNTPYNSAFWNHPPVQANNNCYNYSMNYRSDTFAQPGRISGHPGPYPPNCAGTGAAAAWDGCRTTCSGSNKLVALVIWPGVDYHWYRRHSEGFWGHKPGGTPARNWDESHRVINGTTLTPGNCNRGPYTIFCNYRFSPTGMHVR